MAEVDVGALAGERRAQIAELKRLGGEQGDRLARLTAALDMLDAVEPRLQCNAQRRHKLGTREDQDQANVTEAVDSNAASSPCAPTLGIHSDQAEAGGVVSDSASDAATNRKTSVADGLSDVRNIAAASMAISDSSGSSSSGDFADTGLRGSGRVNHGRLPRALRPYLRFCDTLTTAQIGRILSMDVMAHNGIHIVEDGGRPGILAAFRYQFLEHCRETHRSTPRSHDKVSPVFVHVMLNNASVKAAEDLYKQMWRVVRDDTTAKLPASFIAGYMSRAEVSKELKQKSPIVITTLGRLADLLDKDICLDSMIGVVFQSLNAMAFHNEEDAQLRKVFSMLRPCHKINFLLTAQSDDFIERLNDLMPPCMQSYLAEPTRLPGDLVRRLASMMPYIEFIPVNIAGSRTCSPGKYGYLLDLLADGEKWNLAFGACQVLIKFNYKDNLYKLAKALLDRSHWDIPIFHGGEQLDPKDRWRNFEDFESMRERVLLCTRRSLDGCSFDFTPAHLHADLPRSTDEWRHIGSDEKDMHETRKIALADSGIEPDRPMIKFFVDTQDEEEMCHFRYLQRELRRLGIADIRLG